MSLKEDSEFVKKFVDDFRSWRDKQPQVDLAPGQSPLPKIGLTEDDVLDEDTASFMAEVDPTGMPELVPIGTGVDIDELLNNIRESLK